MLYINKNSLLSVFHHKTTWRPATMLACSVGLSLFLNMC